jgi:DNA-directed RNA polymerase specialized sigma24 family protein
METCAATLDSRERFEVFHHALVDRDPEALANILAWYRPLMIAWARQKLARMPMIEESYDDIADEAFARAWFALVATGIGTFPNLAAVLAYLRTCVASVIADRARAQSRSTRILTRMEVVMQPSPEQEVLAEINRAEVWSRINQHVVTEQEKIVVYKSIILSLPPRTILRQHPSLFNTIAEIYQIKRNLFDRLRRDNDLRQLFGEL